MDNWPQWTRPRPAARRSPGSRSTTTPAGRRCSRDGSAQAVRDPGDPAVRVTLHFDLRGWFAAPWKDLGQAFPDAGSTARAEESIVRAEGSAAPGDVPEHATGP